MSYLFYFGDINKDFFASSKIYEMYEEKYSMSSMSIAKLYLIGSVCIWVVRVTFWKKKKQRMSLTKGESKNKDKDDKRSANHSARDVVQKSGHKKW